ncbi:MAG TPA: hypothetical protein VHU15_18540, partial [Stellaceae bacterium]|nr:hypothetical protein [Stellaceae bacterium]
DAWFWPGSSLTEDDPELPINLVDALFQSTTDEVYRLRVADMSLRHARLSKRNAAARRALDEMPSSWARDRIQRLLSEPDGPVAGLVGNGGGVVSGVINLESSGVSASDWRPRHDERYHEA